MPTAPDAQVYINWNKVTYLGIGEDLRHIWLIDCQLIVGGVQIVSQKVFTNSTTDAWEGKFLSALEEKRLEYVSE